MHSSLTIYNSLIRQVKNIICVDTCCQGSALSADLHALDSKQTTYCIMGRVKKILFHRPLMLMTALFREIRHCTPGVYRFMILRLAVLSLFWTFSGGITHVYGQAEIHPSLLYKSGDIDSIKERLSREPYSSWFARLIREADGFLSGTLVWGPGSISLTTQGYRSKILACAYVLSDSSNANRETYALEAARCLYSMPRSSYKNVFPSDLEISEAALYWAETYDMLKGAGYDFAVDGIPETESYIRESFSKLRDYMSRDLYEGIFPYQSSIQKDFPSVAYDGSFIKVEHTDNHHVKLNASLTALSLAIYNVAGSSQDFSRGYSRLIDILGNMTITGDSGEPAGGWAEGPNYHKYSSHEYIPVLYSLWKQNLFDYGTATELAETHLWLPRIVMPDGYMPPIDENEAVIFDPAGLLYSHHRSLPGRDMLLWLFNLNGAAFDTSFLPDYLMQFDDSPPVYNNPAAMGWAPTDFFPESGFGRFRSSWDSDAVYLLFLAEHGEARINGQAHENPDPCTFILHAYGKLLILDSGYGGWSNRDYTRFAENHNLILVDDEGPEPASQGGLFNFWYANGENAYLRRFFTTPALDYACAETRYSTTGTDFSRHIVFPGHRYFFMYDRVENPDRKTYTLLLHGNGGGTSGGTFTPEDSGAVWSQDTASVRSFSVGSSDLTFETADMHHAVYTRSPMLTHTVLKVIQSGTDEEYLTLLFPWRTENNPPVISEIVVEGGKGICLADHDTTAYGCMRVESSSMSWATTAGEFRSDGEFLTCAATPSETVRSAFVIYGTFMVCGQDTLMTATYPVVLSTDYSQPMHCSGYIQPLTATTVTIFGSLQPRHVTFDGEPIEYSIINNNIQFTINDQGPFSIEYSEPNRPPVILTSSLPDAREETPYSFSLSFEDPDQDDQVTVELIVRPGWLNVDDAGRLTGTPSGGDGGTTSPLLLRVIDSGGLADTLSTTIFVENVLAPPVNLSVGYIPGDQGHMVRLAWGLSPDEEHGFVELYRIYRSRSGILTDPVPVTAFTSVDSLIAWEAHFTVLMDSVAAGVSEYIDASILFNDVDYYYWVEAVGYGLASEKVPGNVRTAVEPLDVRFNLEQPHPNPFNRAVTIAYSIPGESIVSVDIYTVSGQKVEVLVNEMRPAGRHAVTWNARNMPSGVYVCMMRARGHYAVKKLLLLK